MPECAAYKASNVARDGSNTMTVRVRVAIEDCNARIVMDSVKMII